MRDWVRSFLRLLLCYKLTTKICYNLVVTIQKFCYNSKIYNNLQLAVDSVLILLVKDIICIRSCQKLARICYNGWLSTTATYLQLLECSYNGYKCILSHSYWGLDWLHIRGYKNEQQPFIAAARTDSLHIRLDLDPTEFIHLVCDILMSLHLLPV